MIMGELERLNGKKVEVVYNTVSYHGILSGVSESEIYLQTQSQWLTLPLEGVSQVREA